MVEDTITIQTSKKGGEALMKADNQSSSRTVLLVTRGT